MRVAYVAGGEHFFFDIPEAAERPAAPCTLYRAFAPNGTLLYVGISGHAPTRLKQHRKGAAWFHDAAFWTYETFASRAGAAAAELNAIHGENPMHNIKGVCRAA